MSFDFKYCVVCLVSNVKMYSFNDSTLSEMYLNLVDEMVNINEDQNLCLECIIQLRKCVRFREKCLKTLEILGNINDFAIVTKRKIDAIDRDKFNLTSTLTVTPPKVNMYDLWIKAAANENITCEEIKVEGALFAEEDSKLDCVFQSINEKTEPPIIDFENIKGETQFSSLTDELKDEVILNSIISNDIADNNLSDDNKSCSSDSVFNTKLKENLQQFIKNIDVKSVKRERKKTKRKSAKKSKTVALSKKCDTYSFQECISVISMTHEDAVAEIMLRKEKNNYKNGVYKCEICFKGFHYDNTYQNHMKTHSDGLGTFECEYCHTRFNTRTKIKHHIEIAHKTKYMCKKCPYVCFSSTQAKGHVRFHIGEKYKCPDCGREFRMTNSLSTHRRIYHKASVSCELCGESLGSETGLAFHRRAMHAQDVYNFEGPKCEECNVHFASEWAWKRHLVLSKKHGVSNGCEHCGDIFPDKSTLREHRKTQHYKKKIKYRLNTRGSAPSECPLCNRQIFSRQEYDRHLKYEHPDSELAKLNVDVNKARVVCEICGKVVKHPSFLRYHQMQHSEERPYKCPVCDKGFKDASNLEVHKKTHTERTRLQCEMCEKQFLTKSALTKHVKANHLGIKPHSCSVCGKSYLNKCEVKLHAKYVHEKVPWPKRDRSKRHL